MLTYPRLGVLVAVLLFCGYQYVGRTLAEKEALEAAMARAIAVAQAKVLTEKLEQQNAAVAALNKKLLSKQSQVKAAQAESDRIAREAAAERERLAAERVPQDCEGAVQWLGGKLRESQQ